MSFMDKVKSGFDKAKEGVSDFAETTKIKHEISKLTDRKNALLAEIGGKVYALHTAGQGVAAVETQCAEIDAIEVDIKKKGEEIVRINTESGGGQANTPAGPPTGAGA